MDEKDSFDASSTSRLTGANRPSSIHNTLAMGAATSDTMLGVVIAGKYRLTRCIGAGGMGTIYEGTDLSLKRQVAVKLLRTSMSQDAKSVQRLQQEGKATSRLDQANIVKVYEFGLHDDQPYLVMEYVEGETLSSILEREHKLEVKRSLQIVRQICHGLEHAHQHGVIHRDLKPSNILIFATDNEEVVKIVDFGIAKLASEDLTVQHLTTTGEIFGSPLYMSPEQCFGYKLDRRSDIYSLGCLLYECLTGAAPHQGDSPLVIISKHQTEEPLSLRQATLGEEFPQELERIAAKMLAKQPPDRYPSAAAVDFDIANLLAGRDRQPAPDFAPLSQSEEFQRNAAAGSARQFQSMRLPLDDQNAGSKTGKRPILLLASMLLTGLLSGYALATFLPGTQPATQTAAPTATPTTTKHGAFDDRSVSGTKIDELSRYPKLGEIEDFNFALANLHRTDGWRILLQMPKLHYLRFTFCDFADSDIKYLAHLPLVELDLAGAEITDAGVQELHSSASLMSTLRVLNLNRMGGFGDNVITDNVFGYLPIGLEELHVKNQRAVKGLHGFDKLLTLKNLRTIDFHGTSLSTATMPTLAKMTTLRHLDLTKTDYKQKDCQQLKALLPDCVIDTSADIDAFEYFSGSSPSTPKSDD